MDVEVVESGGRGSADRSGDLEALGTVFTKSKGEGAPPELDAYPDLDVESLEFVDVDGDAQAVWLPPFIESVGEAGREQTEGASELQAE